MRTNLLAILLLAGSWIRAQECNPNPSYNENFESVVAPALPDCTTTANPSGGNLWAVVDNPGYGFADKALHYQGTAEPADAWFFTNGITMAANTFYKISYKYGNDNADTSETLIFTKGTAPNPDAAEVFITHDAISGGNPYNQSIELYMNTVEGTYFFGFHAASAAAQGSIFVDDITIEPAVCGTPVNVQVTEISQTSATISWEAPTGSNISIFSTYQYAITEIQVPPADGIYNTETTVNITDLLPGQTYYVYNRALCGPVWSDWTEPVEFTTISCQAVTTPYLEDFESAVVPAAPDCILITDAESGNNWATASNPGNGFETQVMQYAAHQDQMADAWFYTPGIQMHAGSFYKVSYRFGNNSEESVEKLSLSLNNPDWWMGDFITHEVITGGIPQDNTVEYINVPADGEYKIGFHAYSDAGQGELYVDNISVEKMECGLPVALTINDVTDTSATLSWAPPTTGNTDYTAFQYAVTTENIIPGEGIVVNTPEVTVAELAPQTTYYVFIRTKCGQLWSDWVQASFTTEATAGIKNNALAGFIYYPNPVGDKLTLVNPVTIDTVELYNSIGQLVHRQITGAATTEIDLQDLSSGIYLLQVKVGEQLAQFKIIRK